MLTIDEQLEKLQPGESIYISCPTPYCSGIGGRCAECETIWSECGCLCNELRCLCGKKVILEIVYQE